MFGFLRRRQAAVASTDQANYEQFVRQLREWEGRMTSAEMSDAFAFVASHGWKPGDQPPAYVWAAAYQSAAPAKRPA